MIRYSLTGLAAMAALAGVSAPGAAQQAAEPKVNQLIIYGDDKCPEGAGDEIVVCARKAESERYRIPSILRESSSPDNEAWTNKVIAYETVGRSGTQSCTPVGPGGWTGCSSKMIRDAYAEKATGSDVRMAELVAEERAKRLATIDAEAAETQKRVEQAEKEYLERQKAQEDAATKAPTNP
ncbi:hypothetical protein B0I00_2694 [Novosphingobium kunmingense]|uniref:Uncharacterized protein n=1 Tax=Novosphingobium kunmingense TaxID=1211806 RepID=A0A2N0H558_9SPHN|nr:hypothetical protein [Novosphingobium kunmingense]PKB14066.1 hypothetical protein B0I00_2694 [Novosphingobium kunmingense]